MPERRSPRRFRGQIPVGAGRYFSGLAGSRLSVLVTGPTVIPAFSEKRHRLTLEALADVEAGRTLEHAEVEAWVATLGKPTARGTSWNTSRPASD
jgi:hypothetical protein